MLTLLKHMRTLSLFLFLLLSSFHVSVSGDSPNSPFTPKAYLIRYYKKKIANDLPKPWFLNKASPLSAAQSALFSKLASQNSLSENLAPFCSAANLLCFPDLAPSLAKHDQDVNFATYSDKNFTNYGTQQTGGVDQFQKYSDDDHDLAGVAKNTFTMYSRDTVGHEHKFDSYGNDSYVVDQQFNTYGTKSVADDGKFTNYGYNNIPNLKFTTYSVETSGGEKDFTSYSKNSNSGSESFGNYGKNGSGAVNVFTNYANTSNVIDSNFNAYGEAGFDANDTFTSYGYNGNVPQNNFKNYGNGAFDPIEKFTSYRDQFDDGTFKYHSPSDVGADSFQSYAKKATSGEVNFINYGSSLNVGTDKFSGYANGAQYKPKIGFKGYDVNNTFKEYGDKKSVSFASYKKSSQDKPMSISMMSGKPVNKWIEPGKFFREAMLKEGTIMPMPDIRDKMPKRSFLPRVILSKLPFSSSKIEEMKKIFHAGENSSMEGMLVSGLKECERPPAMDETKRCVGSAEDMIDFTTSVLGKNIAVRTTENTVGSKGDILIGSVKGINGGKITKSVSCHQSLFPYLLYYCHSVPKVRVYEADILDTKTKNKINHGVAICHIDTSAWSATHGAFLALGSKPGKIEVCHWIFENDLTWAIVD